MLSFLLHLRYCVRRRENPVCHPSTWGHPILFGTRFVGEAFCSSPLVGEGGDGGEEVQGERLRASIRQNLCRTVLGDAPGQAEGHA